MALDRWLNLVPRPPFLAVVGQRDAELWRVLVLIAVCIPLAGFTGLIAYGLFDSLSEEIAALTPEVVKGLVSPPLAPVRIKDVAPALGLVGESRRILAQIAPECGVLLVLPLFGAAVMGRSWRTWFTSAPRFRWRLLAAGLVGFCAITGLAMGIDGLMHGFAMSPPLLRTDEAPLARLIYACVTLVAFLIVAAAEEVLFRGWMMQQTSVVTTNLVLVLGLNATAFMFVHLEPDPARNIALLASGVSLGWIALRTGGLEFGIGVHAANNLMIAWFSSPDRITDLSGRMSAGDLVLQLSVTLSGLGLAEAVRRSARWQRWTGQG